MIAAFWGLYLTALLAAHATPNVLIPTAAHSLCDFIAFDMVVIDYRRKQTVESRD